MGKIISPPGRVGAFGLHFGRYMPRQSGKWGAPERLKRENAGLWSGFERVNAGLCSGLEREIGVSGADV